MSDSAINVLRWVLLASAVLNILQATVLFSFFERRIFQPWTAFNDRRGIKVPTSMRDERMRRFWPWFMAVALLSLWSYFGTPAGIAFLHNARR
jgi:hypothetical protein